MSNLSKAFALMFLGGGTLGGGIALANYNPPIARQAALDDCKTSGARNPSNVTENPYLKSLEKGVANGVIPEPSNNATFTVTNAHGEKVKITWAQRKECSKLANESDQHDTPYKVAGTAVSLVGIGALIKSLGTAAKGNDRPSTSAQTETISL